MLKNTLVIFVLAGLLACAVPLWAEEASVEELKAQIRALQERVEQLEETQQPQDRGAVDPWKGLPQRYRLDRWDPFLEMQRMQQEMNRMFQDSFSSGGDKGQGVFSSRMGFDYDFDMMDKGDHYEMVFDMSGLDEDSFNIEINQGSLTVQGERLSEETQQDPNAVVRARSFGSFMRTIPLPPDADTGKVETKKQEGQLIIRLPKKQ
ncbi:MAG: Hsp20/alpha crystallin family protein [Candidatus Omnitrophota bacterium]